MKAYVFWYVFDYLTERTEYIYVIAVSHKQACFFFNKYMRENVGKVYDKASEACNEIDEADFLHNHEIGEVLGVCAVI